MKTLRYILCSAALACGAFGLLATSQDNVSAEAQPFERRANYDISLGGLTVAEAKLTMRLTDDGYAAAFELKSDGLLDWFYEAWVLSEANGVLTADGRFAPSVFIVRSQFDDRPQDLDLQFSETGPDTVFAEPPFKPRPWQLDPIEQTGSVDPISAAVLLMQPHAGSDVCDRKVDVFDGRRRHEVALIEELEREQRDGYVKVECKATWRRVAGFKPKYMDLPPNEFMIRIHVYDDGFLWPVRAWAETDWGAVVAVLD